MFLNESCCSFYFRSAFIIPVIPFGITLIRGFGLLIPPTQPSLLNLSWTTWWAMIIIMLWMFISLFGWIDFLRKLKFSCRNSALVLLILLIAFNVVCPTWPSGLLSFLVSYVSFSIGTFCSSFSSFAVLWHYILQAFSWSAVSSHNMFGLPAFFICWSPFP